MIYRFNTYSFCLLNNLDCSHIGTFLTHTPLCGTQTHPAGMADPTHTSQPTPRRRATQVLALGFLTGKSHKQTNNQKKPYPHLNPPKSSKVLTNLIQSSERDFKKAIMRMHAINDLYGSYKIVCI